MWGKFFLYAHQKEKHEFISALCDNVRGIKMANRKVDTGIVQRGKSYFFTAYLGYDVNGKQIRKTSTYTPPEDVTQKKADKLAKEAVGII